jgi:MoxR-like ATPase
MTVQDLDLGAHGDSPDRRDGRVYVMAPDTDLAVQVALATGRPLLLRGDPGCGKSSLAPYIARQRGWRYYETVVTAHTRPRDLLWTFDAVRRLADAQSGVSDRPLSTYVEPGALWWAFAPSSARFRGDPSATVTPAIEPFRQINESRSADRAVVLVDEIDKADPDLPNGLLVPLGTGSFVVTETNAEVSRETAAGDGTGGHLVVITTNEERELPEAFLRRCVVAWLRSPDLEGLLAIADAHFAGDGSGWSDSDRKLARAVAETVIDIREVARHQGVRPASTAEFLDALRALRRLGIGPGSDQWRTVCQFTLYKPQQPGGDGVGPDLAW